MVLPTALVMTLLAGNPLPASLLTDLPPPTGPGTYELQYNNWVDLPLAGGSLLLVALTEGPLKTALAPAHCFWCDRAADGTSTLNALDSWARGARWADIEAADTTSNVVAYAAGVPLVLGAGLASALRSHAANELAEDGVIVAEAVGLDLLVNNIVKFSAGRERPFVHVLPEADKPFTQRPNDNNLSFWSGHTSFIWSLTFATAAVAELRGYQDRWWIWAVGAPLCLAVPYLRIAADRHYLTDVLVGAAAGAAFGIGVPVLLHGRKRFKPLAGSSLTMQVSVGPSGASVAGAF